MKKIVMIGIFLLLLFSLSLTGCSEQSTTGTPAEKTTEKVAAPVEVPKGAATVEIIGDSFVPETLTIKVGGSVQWVNKDATSHTVSFSPESILDKVIKAGQNTVATFPTAGTYKYKDKFGKALGIITVQ